MNEFGDPLKPCPLCGAGETEVYEHRNPGVSMSGELGNIISVEVRHWCAKQSGVVNAVISIRGRDHASAFAAWNRRL